MARFHSEGKIRLVAVLGIAMIFGVGVGVGMAAQSKMEQSAHPPPAAPSAPAAALPAMAVGQEAVLESAFIRVAQQMGPAVVSISTEQVERFRHPFAGQGLPSNY